MARLKSYAMWYVPWEYQDFIPRARVINCFRAIEMLGKSNQRQFIERHRVGFASVKKITRKKGRTMPDKRGVVCIDFKTGRKGKKQ